MTLLQVGLMRRWQGRRVQPHVVLGVGGARLDSPSLWLDEEDRFSASFGGGLKVPLNDWLSFRVEARGTWIDLPPGLEGDEVLVELSSGLGFRF